MSLSFVTLEGVQWYLHSQTQPAIDVLTTVQDLITYKVRNIEPLQLEECAIGIGMS
jgi:hypothetical protein